MIAAEPSSSTTASPGYPSICEKQDNVLKSLVRKIKETFKDDINESLKEIQAMRGIDEEMAQLLRALTALPKILSSIPSNHMVAYSHL